MHVLYEENGGFKAGTVLAESDASLQVEAPHGKRSKIKSAAVMLRFDSPGPAELLSEAESSAGQIDVHFLWECCGEAEFAHGDLAREYCGRTPTAVEAAGILLKLHSAPMYFYRKGKGRYRAAPADILKAALAGQEKKRRIQEQIDQWSGELCAHHLPEGWDSLLPELLYRLDRNKPETKALEHACQQLGLSPARVLEACGALASTHDYHLGRFLFECFPEGTTFAGDLHIERSVALPMELPEAAVAAFSLDDAGTTEIDDAFSVTAMPDGRTRVGIHIAAPALGFTPGTPLDLQAARARLSTVYFPGNKITMLPVPVIRDFSLAEGGSHPAVSLYVDLAAETLAIENFHSVVERVPIVANLRHHNTEVLDQAFVEGRVPDDVPYATELNLLWRFALTLEAGRGKQANQQERPEYNFVVESDRVQILPRRRGAPMDKLVAELMVLANSTWGKLLDENEVAAIYRVQSSGKVRMTTGAAPHQGLGVSHYAWSSSPLRRYVDLVNQWQLLALLSGEAAPFRCNSAELLSAISDFEATYATYGDFQRQMENYWCLRWLLQEKPASLTGEVLRESLVRIDGMPYVARVPSLPELPSGSRVELEVSHVDVLELSLSCQFKRHLEITPTS